MKPGILILAGVSALLLAVLFLTGPIGLRFVKPAPDNVHPSPLVEVFLKCGDNFTKITGNASLSCPFREKVELRIRLINNGSEPSAKKDFAAGVLLFFKGAVIQGYDLGGFRGVIGADERGELVSPVGSRIVELFAEELGPWKSMEARVRIRTISGENLTIRYRGWIMDEDDPVSNPVTNKEEPYIARYPPEDPVTNPPDTRWAGENFLRYKTYVVQVAWIR